jgi:hypothetical protein
MGEQPKNRDDETADKLKFIQSALNVAATKSRKLLDSDKKQMLEWKRVHYKNNK